MKRFLFRGTGILPVGPAGVLPVESSPARKNPTVSGKFAWLPFIDRHTIRKLPTTSAHFKAVKPILQIRESLTRDFKWFRSADRSVPEIVGTLSPELKALLNSILGGVA